MGIRGVTDEFHARKAHERHMGERKNSVEPVAFRTVARTERGVLLEPGQWPKRQDSWR